MVVQFNFHMQANMVRIPVFVMNQRAIWSFAYLNFEEWELAIYLTLHGELDVVLHAVEVNEVI